VLNFSDGKAIITIDRLGVVSIRYDRYAFTR